MSASNPSPSPLNPNPSQPPVPPLPVPTPASNPRVSLPVLFAWGLLGCLVPVAGLVLWLVWRAEKPRVAKAVGVGAIVGVILELVLVAVYLGILFVLLGFTPGMPGNGMVAM